MPSGKLAFLGGYKTTSFYSQQSQNKVHLSQQHFIQVLKKKGSTAYLIAEVDTQGVSQSFFRHRPSIDN